VRAEITMMGVLVHVRTSRMMWKPFMSGRPRSKRMISGHWERMISSPRAPVSAYRTRYSCRLSTFPIKVCIFFSSSMIRTEYLDIVVLLFFWKGKGKFRPVFVVRCCDRAAVGTDNGFAYGQT